MCFALLLFHPVADGFLQRNRKVYDICYTCDVWLIHDSESRVTWLDSPSRVPQ